MTARRTRVFLVVALVTGLVLNLVLVVVCFIRGIIYPDDLKSLCLAFLTAYSIPLGIVVSGLFATKAAPRRGGASGWAALSLSVLWTLLLVMRTLAFALAAEDSVAALTEYLRSVTAASSFLVAGALTFFFARET